MLARHASRQSTFCKWFSSLFGCSRWTRTQITPKEGSIGWKEMVGSPLLSAGLPEAKRLLFPHNVGGKKEEGFGFKPKLLSATVPSFYIVTWAEFVVIYDVYQSCVISGLQIKFEYSAVLCIRGLYRGPRVDEGVCGCSQKERGRVSSKICHPDGVTFAASLPCRDSSFRFPGSRRRGLEKTNRKIFIDLSKS